jgi:hypothetical protein
MQHTNRSNEIQNPRRRDDLIIRDYGLLRADLAKLMPYQSIPLVLIKANVCRILEPKLAKNGFTVLNAGRPIYFPAAGQQKKFQQQFATVLRSQERWPNHLSDY